MKKIALQIKGVGHAYNSNSRILHDINLDIYQGQFVALVGSSGCGKTTLFNSILGTLIPNEGEVLVGDKPVTGPNRNVGIVYQRYTLFDYLTAIENVAEGLKLDQTDLRHRIFMPWYWWPLRRYHLEQSRELLDKFKLSHILDRYPSELSGGQRQRVALARALIMKPKVLLLDEPFGALDEITKDKLHRLLLGLYQENLDARRNSKVCPWTIVFVTQDLDEAFYISDRVVGLSRNWIATGGVNVSGHKLGATIVYDRASPVFTPEGPKDFEVFQKQKQIVKDVVLNDKRSPVVPQEHVTFVSDMASGLGTGVMMS